MSASNTPTVTDFSGFAALKSSARANDPEAVRKAAQQFEALFTQQLLKSARAATEGLGDDVLGGGQTAFYQDMFDQQMALHLSSGKGLGLADVLVRQMIGKTPPATGADAKATLHALPPRGAYASASGSPGSIAPRAVSGTRAMNTAADSPAASAAPGQIPLKSAAAAYASPQDFIDSIRPHAEKAAMELGVPAEVIMAQAALETGWGRHLPQNADGTPSHNYFGIKATADWQGDRLEKTTHEHLGGRMQKVSAEFRAYGSVGEAFGDYVDFLKSNPRYAEALRQGDDAAGFAQGLQKAGYATDPAYATKLLKLVNGVTISRAGDSTHLETPV